MAKQGLTGRGRSFLEVVKGSFQVALHILAHVILADKQGWCKTADARSQMKSKLIQPILH